MHAWQVCLAVWGATDSLLWDLSRQGPVIVQAYCNVTLKPLASQDIKCGALVGTPSMLPRALYHELDAAGMTPGFHSRGGVT